MTPRQATKEREILQLKTDNHATQTAWITVGERTVTLTRQKRGEAATGGVTLTRRDFHALVDWYHRDQKESKQ